MPKFLTRIKTAKERKEKAKSFRVTGYKRWVDPFPSVHGTLPEKMVYAELSRRGIPFYFLNDLRFQIPEIEFDKTYQADFYLPNQNLIIEVQGAFWHSKPKSIEADAFKFAIYETKGYKVLAWWDFDIVTRLYQLFDSEPLLRGTNKHLSASAELSPKVRTKVDTSKGIRTLNQKRGQRLAYRKPPVKLKTKRRKILNGYTQSR